MPFLRGGDPVTQFQKLFEDSVRDQFGQFVGERILSGEFTPEHFITIEAQADAALEHAQREACIDVIYGRTPKES